MVSVPRAPEVHGEKVDRQGLSTGAWDMELKENQGDCLVWCPLSPPSVPLKPAKPSSGPRSLTPGLIQL